MIQVINQVVTITYTTIPFISMKIFKIHKVTKISNSNKNCVELTLRNAFLKNAFSSVCTIYKQ